ncbi:unnamed protein product [Notodromas monacha]|uniref:FH2 domain-containing protein n=1 Tax=Notodromas monacha TaxID=399045 RepID=A0A7R9BV85_9CRUS|nr:unnamed protein product [Notodromas monacha]CAG0922360.1 unnamed protein product [Notodromas monacha]
MSRSRFYCDNYLHIFCSSNEDIILLIKNGEHDDFGAEKLRGLLKILPEMDEVEMLKSFDGDKAKLGNAEKFLLQILAVPSYKLRVESMLLKQEFASQMETLEPAINAIIGAADELKSSRRLQDILYMILIAGNFLNSGGYAGDAAGVKMTSLQKLTDIRANKPGMTLIHYIVMECEKKNKDLLKLPDEFGCLEEASKISIAQLTSDIQNLDGRVKRISQQLKNTSPPDLQSQMAQFISIAEQELDGLNLDLQALERVRIELGEFFCEDPAIFKLEDCFKIFQNFIQKFKQSIQENEKRRDQELQAELRKKLREDTTLRRRPSFGHSATLPRPSSMGSDSDSNIMDSLLSDIRSGFPRKGDKKSNVFGIDQDVITNLPATPRLVRRKFPSTGQDPVAASNLAALDSGLGTSGENPDVTPNGTMRRRRSKIHSEEEGNLMDYLRAGGVNPPDPIPERKEKRSWGGLPAEMYGSLDRSWARRNAGGVAKPRPVLAAGAFDNREIAEAEPQIAQQPAAATEQVQLPDETNANKPKAWRQKIENWFADNEKEEKERGTRKKSESAGKFFDAFEMVSTAVAAAESAIFSVTN